MKEVLFITNPMFIEEYQVYVESEILCHIMKSDLDKFLDLLGPNTETVIK